MLKIYLTDEVGGKSITTNINQTKLKTSVMEKKMQLGQFYCIWLSDQQLCSNITFGSRLDEEFGVNDFIFILASIVDEFILQ